MSSFARSFLLLLLATLVRQASAYQAEPARVFEEARVLETYPFSDPDPVPILTQDERLYPYHAFRGYAQKSVEREWKVVTLENEHIAVYVLPEVGGKVWGAVIKETGREFIYRNEVMKFRNIALRGPWTSGGIEFNFGVIGHSPATATPVDYRLLENDDGSVSCVVGAMDLPSRTHWRVEIRLAPGRSAFETNVTWTNPTPTWQPYYNWMTAAAFARDDLEMFIPGNRYLGHPGESHTWPIDPEGRYLPAYSANRFGGHKSFHVVGELDDHFGGYYHDAGFGFGHWARHEEMPGQKLWLWALSRQGGVWEDLLTDTDGQYVEYQAGRMHVQYSPGAAVNPIRQASFEPGATDRWSETWFPVVGIGGMSDASRSGVLHVQEEEDGRVRVGLNAFEEVTDTVQVVVGGSSAQAFPLVLGPLEVFQVEIPEPATPFDILVPGLGLEWSSGISTTLARPFETDPEAIPAIPEVDRLVAEARELIEGRRLRSGRTLLQRALDREPWHREALVALADLNLRTAWYREGIQLVERARQLDAYDSDANFVAGNLYRAVGRLTDAREAFGWAARSMAFRSVANLQLADLAMLGANWTEALHYARAALDYDRYNLSALHAAAIASRKLGRASAYVERLESLDPLSHLARAERYLEEGLDAESFVGGMRSEFAGQSLLEVAIAYANRGLQQEAAHLLAASPSPGQLARIWAWHLAGHKDVPPSLAPNEVEFTFPFRPETLPVLRAATLSTAHWSWQYLYALNLWALGHDDEAREVVVTLGNRPDLSSFYIVRAHLSPEHAEEDLSRAQAAHGSGRLSKIRLIRYLQESERWEEALAASAEARALYPTDFNLDLLRARTLLYLDRAGEAVEILESTQVLPSENARASHQLFEWAHLMAGLDALEEDHVGQARAHFERALEWPEHLGQGRPYDPDERLAHALLELVGDGRGAVLDLSASPGSIEHRILTRARTLTGRE